VEWVTNRPNTITVQVKGGVLWPRRVSTARNRPACVPMAGCPSTTSTGRSPSARSHRSGVVLSGANAPAARDQRRRQRGLHDAARRGQAGHGKAWPDMARRGVVWARRGMARQDGVESGVAGQG